MTLCMVLVIFRTQNKDGFKYKMSNIVHVVHVSLKKSTILKSYKWDR